VSNNFLRDAENRASDKGHKLTGAETSAATGYSRGLLSIGFLPSQPNRVRFLRLSSLMRSKLRDLPICWALCLVIRP